MKKYLKINGYVYDYVDVEENNIEVYVNEGFKELHETEFPTDYNEGTMELKQEIVEREDGDYEYKYTVVISVTKIEQSISLLKQQLSESDYKVIKNMEAQLVNEELPYDSVSLHDERQALRDKINELEELLKNN